MTSKAHQAIYSLGLIHGYLVATNALPAVIEAADKIFDALSSACIVPAKHEFSHAAPAIEKLSGEPQLEIRVNDQTANRRQWPEAKKQRLLELAGAGTKAAAIAAELEVKPSQVYSMLYQLRNAKPQDVSSPPPPDLRAIKKNSSHNP